MKNQLETKEVVIVRSQVEKAMEAATKVTIKSDTEYEEANVMLVKIRSVGKLIEKEKKKQLDPANATVKAIRAFWKPLEDRYDEAREVLDKAILGYKKKLEARIEKKEATISKKVEDGSISFDKGVEKIAEIQATPKTHAGVKTRKIPKVELAPLESLTQEEIMSLVKGGFIVWDPVRTRAHVISIQSSGGVLPGARFYEEEITT